MKLIIDISEETYKEIGWHGLALCPRDRENLIKAIKKGTPLEECNDCVSRKQAIKQIEKTVFCYTYQAKQIIEQLPPVTPVELELESHGNPHIYECSCGYGWDRRTMWRDFFCPNCGREVKE